MDGYSREGLADLCLCQEGETMNMTDAHNLFALGGGEGP